MTSSTSHAYRFEKGHLLADMRGGTVTIEGWPVPKATWEPKCGPAEPCRPGFRLVYPEGQEPCPALAEFRRTLPPGIAAVLSPLTDHQWNLLELLAARPEALQLASHNLVLAYLLANNDHFRKNLTKPPAYLAQWRLDYNQERLLEWLGFPGRPAVAKLFRKIEPSCITPGSARLLRIALAGEPSPLSLLSHLKRINRGVLSLVVVPQLRPWLTTKLLEEVSSKADGCAEDDPGERLMRLLAQMNAEKLPIKERPLRGLRSLEKLLTDELPAAQEARRAQLEAERLAREARRVELEVQAAAEARLRLNRARIRVVPRPDAATMRFANSSPPPPDTKEIIRLRREEDAQQEGKEQKNCAGEYAEMIVAEKVFIYRVLKPQRATLELALDHLGWWRIHQLEVAGNKPVASATRDFINHWLSQHHDSVIRRRARLAKAEVIAVPTEDEVPF